MKPKLEVLDALRGFCALIVVLLHLTENYAVPGMHGTPLLSHGHLPVEYFFLLTGFTFVYAYDDRWDRMTVAGFFKRRLLRMHPLVIVGSFLGLLVFFIAPERFPAPLNTSGVGGALLIFLYCCTLLPAPAALGFRCMHMLQGPMWTMSYIYLANILYALILRHLKTWMLGALAIAAAVLSYWAGIHYGSFGNGWLFNLKHFDAAMCRLAYPVLVGMFIARVGWRIRTGEAGLWICIALLSAVFFMPGFDSVYGLYDATAAVFVMPLVLLCGVGGTISNPVLAKVCRFMGAYSFPLFATHYPLRLLQYGWILAHPEAPRSMHIAVGLALAIFMFINAWMAMRLIDVFDNWIKNRGNLVK